MNLVTYWALQEEGRERGLSENCSRVATVRDSGHEARGRAHAGGQPCLRQRSPRGDASLPAKEFSIRAQTIPTIDVIRSATTVAAALLNREGELGTIGPGGRRSARPATTPRSLPRVRGYEPGLGPRA